jgi:hypothetical protein
MDSALKQNKNQLDVMLFFQDEARYGRLSSPRSCWAPFPSRPMVNLAIVREFRYIYSSICPWNGSSYTLFFEEMNTICMNIYLNSLSKKFKHKFIILVLDGASPHRSKSLELPGNIFTIKLPPYSP